MLKKVTALALCAVMLCSGLTVFAAEQFTDVPKTSYAYDDILALREKGITDGVGNNKYGVNQTLKRCDFVIMLARLLSWKQVLPEAQTFADLPKTHYAYGFVEAAAALGATEKETDFRPNDDITRAEMAAMLVNCLGYRTLAQSKAVLAIPSPFTDVKAGDKLYGQIMLARDFGIIFGDTDTTFNPKGNATREQAAAMVMRLYNKINAKVDFLHGFYAFSSWEQRNYAALCDGISVGWARLEYWQSKNGAYLNTTNANSNEWNIPKASDELQALLKENNVPLNLCIYMDTTQKLTIDGTEYRDADLILKDKLQRERAIKAIISQLELMNLNGVTIDFEGFSQSSWREPYQLFLTELKAALGDKYTLYTAVQPPENYKGYDYGAIAAVCDKVIVMAHDYKILKMPDYMLKTDLPKTPVTPFDKVYMTLRGVMAAVPQELQSKVTLAISFDAARWEMLDGKITHTEVKGSDIKSIAKRLGDPLTEQHYSDEYRNPYMKYVDTLDGTTNVVWYEDTRSITDKIELAKLLGITGVSIWRIGSIPDFDAPNYNIWQAINNLR